MGDIIPTREAEWTRRSRPKSSIPEPGPQTRRRRGRVWNGFTPKLRRKSFRSCF